MKVIQRGTMKIVPGKIGDAMELMKKHTELAIKLGSPPLKCFRCLSGRDEYIHTLICEAEWNSLADAEAFFDKMMKDEEMQKLFVKWDSVIDNHWIEFLFPMPMQ